MGYISHFVNGKDNDVSAVAVIFDNKNVGKKTGRRKQTGNMVLIERIQEEILIKKSTTIVRHQFPLKLAWGCTAHKVQGMTVNKVVVNLDRTFAPGQAYVALTRVTSKEGLFIETDNSEKLPKNCMLMQMSNQQWKSCQSYFLTSKKLNIRLLTAKKSFFITFKV